MTPANPPRRPPRAALPKWRAGLFRVVLGQGVVSGTNFLTGILIARSLGIEDFGVFTLFWLVVIFLQSLQKALVTTPLLSFVAKNSAEAQRLYIRRAFTLQVLLLLAISAILFLVMGCILADYRGIFTPLIISLQFIQFHDFLRRQFFAQHKTGLALRIDGVRNGTQIVLIMAAPLYFDTVTIPTYIYCIGASAAAGLLSAAAHFPKKPVPLADIPAFLPAYFNLSKWLVGAVLLEWVSASIYFIIAGLVLGPAAVGALKAAQTLGGMAQLLFQAAENFLVPNIARVLKQSGEPAARTLAKRAALGSFLFTALLALGIGIPGEFWIQTLFGPAYAGYGYVVGLFALAYLVFSIYVPLRSYFIAKERSKVLMRGFLASAVFSAIMSYPLIFWFGLFGAVLGMGMSFTILLGIVYRSFSRQTNV